MKMMDSSSFLWIYKLFNIDFITSPFQIDVKPFDLGTCIKFASCYSVPVLLYKDSHVIKCGGDPGPKPTTIAINEDCFMEILLIFAEFNSQRFLKNFQDKNMLINSLVKASKIPSSYDFYEEIVSLKFETINENGESS